MCFEEIPAINHQARNNDPVLIDLFFSPPKDYVVGYMEEWSYHRDCDAYILVEWFNKDLVGK